MHWGGPAQRAAPYLSIVRGYRDGSPSRSLALSESSDSMLVRSAKRRSRTSLRDNRELSVSSARFKVPTGPNMPVCSASAEHAGTVNSGTILVGRNAVQPARPLLVDQKRGHLCPHKCAEVPSLWIRVNPRLHSWRASGSTRVSDLAEAGVVGSFGLGPTGNGSAISGPIRSSGTAR